MPRNPATPKTEPAPPVAVLDEPKPPKKKSSALGVAPMGKAPPQSPMLMEEVAREVRLSRAREELFFKRHSLLASGEDLSVDEFRVMKTAIPGSYDQNGPRWKVDFERFLAKQDSRVGRIVGLQSAAGTPAERQKADKLAETTREKLDAEGPGIEEQIRELQKQLDALRLAADNAQTAADVRHAAVAGLHDKHSDRSRTRLLPQFIRDELDSLERHHTRDFRKELINMETRRTQIESLFALDVATPEGLQAAKHHASGHAGFGPDEFARREHMFLCERINHGHSTSFVTGKLRTDRWADYLDQLRDELGIIETQLKEIAGGKQAEADEAVEKLRAFYVPE